MPVGKYLMPVIMGESSSDCYLINGHLDKMEDVFLLRHVKIRGLIQSDEKHIARLTEGRYGVKRPTRIIELEVLTSDNKGSIDPQTAALLHGFIRNTLTNASKAPELNQWFLYERPSDVTSLKMAKFSINLMEEDAKMRLLTLLSNRSKSDTVRLDRYR